MKIKINGIFGKYNNEINLDNRCNILIGENGVGKSTTMKIVSSLLKGDFVKLLEYSFDSIEIVDKKEKVTINYGELFLKPTYEDYLGTFYYYIYDDKDNMIEENHFIATILSSLSFIFENDYDTYYKFLVDTASSKDNNTNYLDKYRDYFIENKGEDYFAYLSIIQDEMKTVKDWNEKENADLLDLFYRVIFIALSDLTKNEYEFIKYYANTEFALNEKYKKVYKILKKKRKIFFFSSVKDIGIINKAKINDYVVLNNVYKKLDKYIEQLPDKFKDKPLRTELGIKEDHEYLKELFSKYTIDEIVDYITLYSETKLANNWFFDKKINITSIMLTNYYTEDQVKDFLKEYYTMLKKMINHEYKDEELNNPPYFYDSLYDKFVENYIKYLLPVESMFKNLYHDRDLDSYEFKVFNKFIIDITDKYILSNNENIINLNLLYTKYFQNKKVFCSPSEIIISFDDKLNHDVYLENLSEGEKRIIYIFLLTMLCNIDVFFLDEPETSLSVVWQENLIKDILEFSQVSNLLVATQSPFIVSNDELLDYVVPLPNDIKENK